jgi:hypothetical protein
LATDRTALRSSPRANAVWSPEFLGVWALGALSVALYLPSLRNGFVWDDQAQVLANRWITDWRFLPEILTSGVWDFDRVGITNYYRPLMHVAYALVFHAFGPSAWAFHLLNVALNAVCVIAVTILARDLQALTCRPTSSVLPLIAGALFAVHPVHAEPVLWIAALPELAATACALACCAIYVRHIRDDVRLLPYVGAATVFLVGALFKETALVIPLFLAGCEAILATEARATARLHRLAPFAVAVVVYLALRIHALGNLLTAGATHGRATTGLAIALPITFARYVTAFVWPIPLNAFWDTAWPPSLWTTTGVMAVLVGIGFAVAAVVASRRSRIAALGLALFVIGLLPAFFTSAISGARLAERYLYLPSAGGMLAVAGLLEQTRVVARRGVLIGCAVLVCAASAAVIWVRIPVWRDETTLWSDTVDKSPNAAEPHFNLGVALMSRGDDPGAFSEFTAALERKPDPPLAAAALDDLGRIYERRQQPMVALEYFRRAVDVHPESAAAQSNFGGALAEQGRLSEAVEHLTRAARIRPEEPNTHLNLALVLVDMGRRDEGLAELEEAVRLAPGDAEIQARARAERARVDLDGASRGKR